MEILINSDNHVETDQATKDYYRDELQNSLQRFEEYVTRFEVYFSDEASNKESEGDQKCVIEARIRGKNPERVINNNSSQKAAFDGAVDKIKKVLTKVVEQQRGY